MSAVMAANCLKGLSARNTAIWHRNRMPSRSRMFLALSAMKPSSRLETMAMSGPMAYTEPISNREKPRASK